MNIKENLSWEQKEKLEEERLKPIVTKLIELVPKLDGGVGAWEASQEIHEILQKYGEALINKYGPELYLAEHTSENIAFIKLKEDLYLEISISGYFNVSLTRVSTKEQKDKRIDELLAFEEKGDK